MPSLHSRRAYAYSQAHDGGERGLGARPAMSVGIERARAPGGRCALARPAYALYTRRLRRDVRAAAAPRHLAVILDGNRRWAPARA